MPCKRFALATAMLLLGTNAIHAEPRTFDFAADTVGAPPAGFTMAKTGGGKPGVWLVQTDAALGKKVLVQSDPDKVDMRFPVALVDAISAANLDLAVKFKPISGAEDMAAGLVWRYRDKDNYYVVRANALENNVVLYKVEKGRRSDLPLKGKGKTYGVKVSVPKGEWSTLRIAADGKLFTVHLNGRSLFEVEDETFNDAGKIGLWTKADSVTAFTDLVVDVK